MDAVVIGASAGGLAALTAVLGGLRASFPAPVFVVQHMLRDSTDVWLGLFSDRVALPIRAPELNEPIVAGTVYMAPADFHLMVESRAELVLSTDALVQGSRPSIDVLFESASWCYREALVAVVLTGASADGAAGARRVRDVGGLVLVQDPKTAEVDFMPAAAIESVPDAEVLSLDGIVRRLVALVTHDR